MPAAYVEPGFGKIFPHHVGEEQEDLVDASGANALAQLRSAA